MGRTLTRLAMVGVLALSGCRLVVGTALVGTAVVVSTAGVAGYKVYKSGEKVVSAVGGVGSSTKGAVQKRQKAVAMSRGTFKVNCEYGIAELHPATERALAAAGFRDIGGRQDSLAGEIHAKTALDESVSVRLEFLSQNLTAVEIKIGAGNLKQSEYIYDHILAAAAANRKGARQ
ncbi:MAG: DUF3568 family protein [Victivallales bacterium]|jgi:hypothetical protein|nr:DUF3568 family protein [Victivallales bacterium]